MQLGSCKLDTGDTELKSNASNLAEVLHVLGTNNPSKFKRLIRYVTDVVPSVKWVTAPIEHNQKMVEVKIWPLEEESEREDLAIELNEAGTGIGQVLAMLYVVFNSVEPRTIIIDEPQSFLHPGAIKKLIEILQAFPQHQYFISTHSPDIITTARPSTVTSLEYEGGVTTAKALDMTQTGELRDVLNAIGVRFGDIFFADSILWVEGPTEAMAFPKILRLSERHDFRISILPLVNTGDLRSRKYSRKHAKLVFEIYNKLSGAHALAPPVVGVILDREDTKSQEMKELQRLGDGLLEFLPRRMFENYLLDPEAISAVANAQENFSTSELLPEQVQDWIEKKRETGDYLDEKSKTKSVDLTERVWLARVDGATLLEDLFRHFSGVVAYSKTKHSVEITAWLVENKPNVLAELVIFLESVMNTAESS
jgi:hypothetical protein